MSLIQNKESKRPKLSNSKENMRWRKELSKMILRDSTQKIEIKQ